jgi:hypothetical protein
VRVLQPRDGPLPGDAHLPPVPERVSWGLLPNVASKPVLAQRSGQSVCVDTVSHEGLLACLSAAADFEVSQVVDRVKGVHGLLCKADLDPLEAPR